MGLPGVRWVAGCYDEDHRRRCQELQQASGLNVAIHYETGCTSEVIEAATACLMVSGSVSLELLARRTPGVVLYRTSLPGKLVARALLSCRYITLTNLIADDDIMPEFLSGGNPQRDIEAISELLTEWGKNPGALRARRRQMEALASSAAITGATGRTADLVLGRQPESAADDRAA